MYFVVSNDDPVFLSGPSGRLQPDVGATLKAIEVASGRQAVRVGKPEPHCLEVILSDFFAADKEKWKSKEFLSKFLYVGDNLETDIMFGKKSGIDTCFVWSGITKFPPSDETSKRLAEIKPDHIMSAFTLSGDIEN